MGGVCFLRSAWHLPPIRLRRVLPASRSRQYHHASGRSGLRLSALALKIQIQLLKHSATWCQTIRCNVVGSSASEHVESAQLPHITGQCKVKALALRESNWLRADPV